MTKFGIGQAVRRVEDQRFLTGAGEFVGDLALPRQCYGVAVLSPHAHARIISVDVSEAEAAPGVVCVLTGEDAEADKIGGIPPHFMPEAWGGPKGFATAASRCCLSDRVRCVGDRVAFVVAETEAQARDAAELVRVDYEPLPRGGRCRSARSRPAAPTALAETARAAMSERPSRSATRPRSMPPSARRSMSPRCDCINNRVTANAIEPRTAIGSYDAASDSYTLYTTSQDPHGVKTKLATARLQHAGNENPRCLAGCRRRLRHEGQHLSRRRAGAVGVAALRPAGQMDGDARRKPVHRHPCARSGHLRRDRTRRKRQDPRGARQRLSGARRLLVGGHHRAACSSR